uniref:CCHC-type domain-containing protein n=1 Tax=Glossina palpalis gambiensis TaxID=67801 RepID=A0A1B0AL45_9MUSC
MDRICKWSVRYDGESCALDFIARIEELCDVYDLPPDIMPRIIMELLNERFEDISTVATTPLLRETSGIPRLLRENAPTAMNTGSASRNVCRRCAQPGHLARECLNQRVLFFWDCGRPGVLTKDCCRQTTVQHIQARGMTVYESIEQRKPPPDELPKTMEITGITVVASLTIGGPAATGVMDTGATRSIVLEDFIGFIPHITNS